MCEERRNFYEPNATRPKRSYCKSQICRFGHKKKLATKANKEKSNPKIQRRNQTTGNPVHMGQTDSAMFQASIGTNTPIKLPNGELIFPRKGTPQGGIISPLLANIVLNELDHWVESNWENNPIVYKYSMRKGESKGNKKVVKSHISDKQLKSSRKALVEQVKRIAKPQKGKEMLEEIWQYNKMVTVMQNYYQIAPYISLDMNKINRAVMAVITNRLDEISRKGRKLTPAERTRYDKSAMLRYLAAEPIYPIGYIQHKIPMNKSRKLD